MSGVRVLVGTRKGAFILTSDGKRDELGRERARTSAGWEMYHLKGSPADPAPALCVAVDGLVRPADPALRRRRRDAGSRSATSSATRACPARTSGTTARRTRGSSLACGTSSRRRPIPTRCTPASKTPRCSAPTTAARPGRSSPACASTASDRRGSPARAACACTRSSLDPRDPTRMYVAISAAGAFRTDDGGQDLAPDQPRPPLRADPRTRLPRSATACTASRCIRRGRTCCSCRSTGT